MKLSIRKRCGPELIEFITEDILWVFYKLQFLNKIKWNKCLRLINCLIKCKHDKIANIYDVKFYIWDF